jgi:hypothetical protein
MPGPQPDELVFTMSNNMKTQVQFKTKHKHNKFIRVFGKIAPTRGMRRKANQRVMVQKSEADLKGWEGTCAALSAMYLRKAHELGVVSRRDEVEQSFQISIAQGAFERWDSSDYAQKRERLLELMGMKVIGSGIQVTLSDTFTQICDNPGLYMVALRFDGGGGHMIAFRNCGGGIYFFFEPEEGLYRFPTGARFEEAVSAALLSQDLTSDSTTSWWETELD